MKCRILRTGAYPKDRHILALFEFKFEIEIVSNVAETKLIPKDFLNFAKG
jgi:hypothetical protein